MLIPKGARFGHRARMARFGAAQDRARRMGERGEIVGLRRDGSEFPAEASIVAVREGGAPYYCAIVRDLTNAKTRESLLEAALTEAQAANKAKSDFLANMSHELRTPLNSVIGFAEVMIGLRPDAEAVPLVREYARHIRDAGSDLLSMIDDVLFHAKLESGARALNENLVPGSTLIESCLSGVAERAAARGITVSWAPPAELAHLCVDTDMIRRALGHLLGNAVEYSDEGGTVAVTAGPDASGGFRISVCDSGQGMAPHVLARAAEPFVQGEQVLTKRHKGAGLGLALAKQIAGLHGGAVELTSTPGRGTAASIVLPADRVLEAGEPRQDPCHCPGADRARGSNRRVDR